MYLIRKINAITAKVFGIIFSISNVVKSIYTDDESKSKNDMNNIINVEYIRTKVQITFNTMTNFFWHTYKVFMFYVDRHFKVLVNIEFVNYYYWLDGRWLWIFSQNLESESIGKRWMYKIPTSPDFSRIFTSEFFSDPYPRFISNQKRTGSFVFW